MESRENTTQSLEEEIQDLKRHIELLDKRIQHFKRAIIDAQIAINFRGYRAIKSIWSDLQDAMDSEP